MKFTCRYTYFHLPDFTFRMSTLSSQRCKRVYIFSFLLFILSISGLCSAQSFLHKNKAPQRKTAVIISAKAHTFLSSEQQDSHLHIRISSHDLSATFLPLLRCTALAQTFHTGPGNPDEHQRGAFRLAKLDRLDRLFFRYVILRGPLLQKGRSSRQLFQRRGAHSVVGSLH